MPKIRNNEYFTPHHIWFNSLHAGNFSCFCCCLLNFIKLYFFKKFIRNTIRASNGLDPDQDGHFVSPDLGQNCLQRLSVMTRKNLHMVGSKILITISPDLDPNCLQILLTDDKSRPNKERVILFKYYPT